MTTLSLQLHSFADYLEQRHTQFFQTNFKMLNGDRNIQHCDYGHLCLLLLKSNVKQLKSLNLI